MPRARHVAALLSSSPFVLLEIHAVKPRPVLKVGDRVQYAHDRAIVGCVESISPIDFPTDQGWIVELWVRVRRDDGRAIAGCARNFVRVSAAA